METHCPRNYEFNPIQIVITKIPNGKKQFFPFSGTPTICSSLFHTHTVKIIKKGLKLTPVFLYFAAPNFTHVKGYSINRTERYP